MTGSTDPHRTEPRLQSDIVLLKPRTDHYAAKKIRAEDALVVLEIAETTLSYDIDVKLPRYAAAGVPEVWIENLKDNTLLVYRDPAGAAFATSEVKKRFPFLAFRK